MCLCVICSGACFPSFDAPISLLILVHGHADNVWWSTGEHTDHSWRHHPHPDAPRCIPCHYDDSSFVPSPEATIPSFKAIKGCPCTPKLLCAHNNHSDHMSEDWFNKYCDMPRLPYHMYSMHGGAGALMSVGLMRKVGWDIMEPCVLKTLSTGACPIHLFFKVHAPFTSSSRCTPHSSCHVAALKLGGRGAEGRGGGGERGRGELEAQRQDHDILSVTAKGV